MDPCAYLAKWSCLKQSSCAYTFERGYWDLKSILLFPSFQVLDRLFWFLNLSYSFSVFYCLV